MAATAASQPPVSHFWEVAPDLFERLQRAGADLAISKTVPPDVEKTFEALADALPEGPDALVGYANPYLVLALYASTTHGLAALLEDDPNRRRRALRIPLERARQALRDLLDEQPIMEGQPLKQVAEWLLAHDEVPASDLARLLDVSPSTLRRWADPTATTAPRGTDARKVRVLARVINQLRWSFTTPGVVEWLERPHPALKGEPPSTLLTDPESGPKLVSLAASTRVMTLT